MTAVVWGMQARAPALRSLHKAPASARIHGTIHSTTRRTHSSPLRTTDALTSYFSLRPRRIWIASGTLGSPTSTCWKRRSNAASFSMCCRYSASVVAPMVRSSPRASIGLSRLAASMEPCARRVRWVRVRRVRLVRTCLCSTESCTGTTRRAAFLACTRHARNTSAAWHEARMRCAGPHLGLAGAQHRVNLVDEQHDAALGLLDLRQHRLGQMCGGGGGLGWQPAQGGQQCKGSVPSGCSASACSEGSKAAPALHKAPPMRTALPTMRDALPIMHCMLHTHNALRPRVAP